jgi:BirA family biotin operon repressor/biotin-[acetyl-CoA-carboxylase] ligase
MSEFVTEDSSVLPSASELQAYDVVHVGTVTSTMDEAHARAALGAPAGTVIIADQQTAGRGRSGNSWQSELGLGVWLTLIERPTDAAAVSVLSIRLGLAIANSVQPLSDGPIQLKWPNDLYVNGKKLAGILVEARWREGIIDWVAIGVGINLRVAATNTTATSLRTGTARNEVLLRMVPALRAAADTTGLLSDDEQQSWTHRDLSVGRHVVAPVAGVVLGIEESGALRVQDDTGDVRYIRTGSLVFGRDQALESDNESV